MKYLIILGLCLIGTSCSRPEKKEVTPKEQEMMETPPGMIRVFTLEC